MRLRELMSRSVVTIDKMQKASTAWSRMRQHRIRHLVVTDNGYLAGVVSDRDLGGERGTDLRKGRAVQEMMTERIISAEPDMTLRQAANIMRGRVIGSLPVLDGDRLVGIVTATDVLDALGRGSSRLKPRGEGGLVRTPPSRRITGSSDVVRRATSPKPTGRVRPPQTNSPARAPLPAEIAKSDKRGQSTGNSQVPAHIRSRVGDLGPDNIAYIRHKLGSRLGKFSGSIERLSVRTDDVNGPRGGVDQLVRIKIVLKGLPSVVFESRDASLNAAIDNAISGAERNLRRTLQRRRMKPLASARATMV
jgi:CBS domain-containing protein